MPESLPEVHSVGIALRSFEVTWYELVDQERSAVGYNWKNEFLITADQITLRLTVTAFGTEGNLDDRVAIITTETSFHVIGLDALPGSNSESLVVPNPIMANLINIAVGTTRGAMSELSNGKFLFPLVDATALLPKENSETLEPSLPPQ